MRGIGCMGVSLLAVAGGACVAGAGDERAARPPVALIELEEGVRAGTVVTMVGSGSYDPDNYSPDPPHGIAAYAWSIADAPAGSGVSLSDASLGDPTVTPDLEGDYTVSLSVTDAEGLVSDAENATFAAAAPTPTPLPIEFELTWDTSGDVDVHVVNVTAGGTFFDSVYDCHWRNLDPDWGDPGFDGDPFHDFSSNSGPGPEHTFIQVPEPGPVTYRLIAHYWSDDASGAALVNAAILVDGAPVHSSAGTLANSGSTWEVAEVTWPSQGVTVLDNFYDYMPP